MNESPRPPLVARQLVILMSAPSLDSGRNVSGVSSVAAEITRVLGAIFAFKHLQVGSEQGGGFPRRQLRSMGRFLRSIFIVLLGNYDIYHSNTDLSWQSALRDSVVTTACLLRGRDLVIHLHGGYYMHNCAPPLVHAVIRRLLRGADKVVVLSTAEREIVVTRYGVNRNSVEIVVNAIHMPLTLRKRRVQREEPLVVAFVGRLVETKGLLLLLDAVGKLGMRDKFQFRFYGDGPLRPEVVNAASEFPNVSYLGIFSRSAVEAIMSEADILILPSLFEGLPMSVVEAMAYGAVPVCTPTGSLPGVIVDGESGYFIETGSVDAIVRRLSFLELRRDELVRVSHNAHAVAAANFDSNKALLALARVYEGLSLQKV